MVGCGGAFLSANSPHIHAAADIMGADEGSILCWDSAALCALRTQEPQRDSNNSTQGCSACSTSGAGLSYSVRISLSHLNSPLGAQLLSSLHP